MNHFHFRFYFCSLLYFILRRREKQDKKAQAAKDQAEARAKQADLGETTHM